MFKWLRNKQFVKHFFKTETEMAYFPQVLFFLHLLLFLHFFLIQLLSHHPYICPSIALKGNGVLWEKLSGGWWFSLPAGIEFHWRGESIMLHGEENTGAFLLARASTDQTQNTVFPFFCQLTVCSAPLEQASSLLIVCHCPWRSHKRGATCDW